MAGNTDAACVDQAAPARMIEQIADGEADVARPLPELVREIGNRRVIRIGTIMIERGDDVAARRQKLGEPGVIEAVAAAAMGEHDERTLRAARGRLSIVVELEIAEEGHDETRGGALARGGGVEHGHRQMSV